VVIDTDGEFQSQFVVLGDLTEKLRRESLLGQPEIDAGRLYLPAPTLGSILVYSIDGVFERAFGIRGNLVGELNFPIDVTILDHKIVAVLDKHRFAVVCFSIDGQFLGEFGGMGVSQGKFYHPGYIAHDNQQRVYISQRFMNRVQVCEIPEMIIERLESLEVERGIEPTQSSLQPQLLNNLPEEVVRKTSSTPVSLSSFNFVSKSRRLN
jgi:hypothetical protein